MVESLKGLSARATPGVWKIYVENTPDLSAAEGEAVMLVRDMPEFSGKMVMLNAGGRCPALTGCSQNSEANAEFIASLVNAYRSGQLHDDTALAAAEARGRRQGLEEAAKNDHSKDFQLLIVRIIQRHRNGRDLTETLEGAADLLKRKGSLSPFRATAPAETQKPETGETDARHPK